MRIALDAMGTDSAPFHEVEGAVKALRRFQRDCEIILVGDRERIEAAGAAIHAHEKRLTDAMIHGIGNLAGLADLPGVEQVSPLSRKFKLVSKDFQPEATVVRIGDLEIGGDRGSRTR